MRIVPLSLAAIVVAGLATAASAQGVLRYSWGADANAVVSNQDWAGPIVYSQNVSVTGLTGTIDRIVVEAEGPGMPPAWAPLQYFESGPTGTAGGMNCLNTASRASVSATLAGAQPIPGGVLYAGSHVGITNPTVTHLGFTVEIDPPLVADPAARYAIARLDCDLVDATVGYVPGHCPWAEGAMCFRITSATAHPAGAPYGADMPIALGGEDVISWQGGNGVGYCLSVTPARTRTWGELKTRYR